MLKEYIVERDKFELDPQYISTFDFPCCVCKWSRIRKDSEEPCRTCDHNVGSVPDDDGEQDHGSV